MRAISLLVLLFSTMAYAQLEMSPRETTQTKPGDIVSVDLYLTNKDVFNDASPQRLKETSVDDTLWFMSVGTWELKDDNFSTEAKVVLGSKFNPAQSIQLKLGNSIVELSFRDWRFTGGPQQVEGELVYQDIAWYRRPWWKKYGLYLAVGTSILFLLSTHLFLSWKKRKEALAKEIRIRNEWINRLDRAQGILELSKVWAERDELNLLFVGKEASLRSFFDVLNKYQFKPTNAHEEIQTVLIAKTKLINELREAKLGV